MIQLNVDCLRFGSLALTGAPHGAFNIVHLGPANNARIMARVEVEHGHNPSLRFTRLEPRECFVDTRSAATVERVVLSSWRDNTPAHFELTALDQPGGLEIVLSGDVRHRLFSWRLRLSVINGEVVAHGPSLANDPDT